MSSNKVTASWDWSTALSRLFRGARRRRLFRLALRFILAERQCKIRPHLTIGPATAAQVGIGCMLLATSLFAQKDIFIPANDVSLTVSTERNSYGVREQIAVKYQIVNVSDGQLFVPRAWEATCPANPHVWAWFENKGGQHFLPGYGGSCIPSTPPQTVTERMSKEAVLLSPGEHLDGALQLDPTFFGGLPPGEYRIEAVLYGWKEDKFTNAERAELARMGSPLLTGEVPASVRITLTR